MLVYIIWYFRKNLMEKYFLYGVTILGLYACSAGGSNKNFDPNACPAGAPLFTEAVGTSLINHWGDNVFYYSPYGSGGYTDPYVGAAYFTANEYLFDAVLSPTVSPVTRVGSQEIYNYFTRFLSHGPRYVNNPGTPESGGPFVTLAGCGYGVISGYYNFRYQDGDVQTNARYTFQFEYQPSSERISIVVESGPQMGSTITVNQAPGWYIALQNSARLPSVDGIAKDLIIK
jgi:hypothetical protein